MTRSHGAGIETDSKDIKMSKTVVHYGIGTAWSYVDGHPLPH